MIMTLLTRRPFEPWTIAGEYKTHWKNRRQKERIGAGFRLSISGSLIRATAFLVQNPILRPENGAKGFETTQ
jgi:hypothetical protein